LPGLNLRTRFSRTFVPWPVPRRRPRAGWAGRSCRSGARGLDRALSDPRPRSL